MPRDPEEMARLRVRTDRVKQYLGLEPGGTFTSNDEVLIRLIERVEALERAHPIPPAGPPGG